MPGSAIVQHLETSIGPRCPNCPDHPGQDRSNGIYAWIFNDSGERRADATAARIDKAMSRVSAHPKSGRVRTEYPGAPRSIAVSPWVIFYRPLPDGEGAEILRVLDGRQDLDRILGGDQ